MADRVFVLGAGFSKAIHAEMPVMAELGAAVDEELNRQGRPLPLSLGEFGGDLEQLLSYLADSQPWLDPAEILRHRAAFLDVSRAVARVLHERQLASVQSRAPDWLEALIDYWHRMESTVITFNYDVLVEAAALARPEIDSWRALYRAPVVPAGARTSAVLGGEPSESFALLKLHGSVTWFWSGVDSNPSDPIYDAGIRGGWSLDGLTSLYERDLEVLVADKVPMVVPPAATKSAFYDNSTLRSQWQAAAGAIAGASELVLIGYSLPPSDLVVRSLLRTSFDGDLVLPVDVGTGVVEQVRGLFGERVMKTFAGHDDAVARFVAATCS